MSRLVIALFALASVAFAFPAEPQDPTPIPIVKQSQDGPNPDGTYHYAYETANGIQVEEKGHLNHIDEETVALHAAGYYSYPDHDGNILTVKYVANEGGFQPEGAHLPTAPPVPPQILRALEYIQAHPEENEENTH